MSLTKLSLFAISFFVFQDLIGSEVSTIDYSPNSSEEGMSTVMPDGGNSPSTKTTQIVFDELTYSSMNNLLNGNPSSTGVPHDEASQTPTAAQGPSNKIPPNNPYGLISTTEPMVETYSTPVFPTEQDFQRLENTSRREEPKDLGNESAPFEDSAVTIEMNSTSDGFASATLEPKAGVNESGTSEPSTDVMDSGDNKVGLISKEVWEAFNDVAGDLWLPVCAIGIVANILNIIVFMDRRMRNATSYYLAAISVFQISYILSSTVTKVHQLIYGDSGQRSTKFFYESAIYFNNYIGVIFSRAVYCMVMIVCFERMIAIVFPMRRARSRLVKSPILCTLSLIILLFLFHLNAVLKYSVEEKIEDGKISYDLKPRGYDMEVLNTFSFVSKILFVYAPLVGILIFNIILCIVLKRHSQGRSNLQEGTVDKRREARDSQTTIAILVSTCLFFFLALPVSTNSILSNLIEGYSYFGGQNRYTFLFMQLAGALLNLTSYSTDFITYVTISSKYRDTLVRKCFPCWMTSKMTNSAQSTMKGNASTKQSIYSSDKS